MIATVGNGRTKWICGLVLAASVLLAGCKGNSGIGTVLGGVAGAGVGYALGGTKGAIIGGLAGLAIGTLVEHLIRKNSQQAAESGKPTVAEDKEHRVESYPVGRTDEGDKMKVVTVVYDKKTEPSTGKTTYTRSTQDNGKPVPLVEEEVPISSSSSARGLAEGSGGGSQVVTEQDVRVTTRKTVDASGRPVVEITKTSPAGTETFVYADTEAGAGGR